MCRCLSVLIPEHRPAIHPSAWQQTRNAPHSFMVLKEHGIPLSICSLPNTTLCHTMMRETKVITKDSLAFVRSNKVVGTETEFCAYSPCWPPYGSHVILSINFISMHTLVQSPFFDGNDFRTISISVSESLHVIGKLLYIQSSAHAMHQIYLVV